MKKILNNEFFWIVFWISLTYVAVLNERGTAIIILDSFMSGMATMRWWNAHFLKEQK